MTARAVPSKKNSPRAPHRGTAMIVTAASIGDPTCLSTIGISNIMNHVSIFGNAQWEILRNEDAHSPFFTSDFPVAIEPTADPRVLSKLVPLTPNLAVRITPRIEMSGADL